jgi:hypothetical protein
LSTPELDACSLPLEACSLGPELRAIANGPGKPGPLVLLDVDSLLFLPVFQPLRDIIIRNEEAQPEQTLLFRYMHSDVIGYFLLSFKSYYKIILFYFHIYSFLNSSYSIPDLLSSLKLAACGFRSLGLGAWGLQLKLLKNFWQLARYDAGSCLWSERK